MITLLRRYWNDLVSYDGGFALLMMDGLLAVPLIMGDKLPSSDKAAVESAVEALKSAISGGEAAAMTSAMEQLTQAQHKAAEALYKTTGATGAPGAEGQGPAGAGPQGSAGPAPSGAPESGDVIDAEVVDDK